MLHILIDIVALYAILQIVAREKQLDLSHVALVSIGLSLANFGCAMLLADSLGVLVIPAIVAIDAAILIWTCYLSLQKAALTVGLLTVYHVLAALFWSWVLGS